MLREAPKERLSSVYPSRVTIDCDALEANVRWIKTLIGADVALMAVVKANAYGHGALAVADIALRNGADMLAVANISEAIELREAGIDAPILVLSFVPPPAAPVAVELDLTVTIYDFAQARAYQSALENGWSKMSAHIKLDSGMGRLGVPIADADALCEFLRELPNLELEGIYTHFSAADDDLQHTSQQLARFQRVLDRAQRRGFRFKYVHAANSAALLTCRDSLLNAARPGLLLYGLNPLGHGRAPSGLRPALSWKTAIAQVKILPAGSPVGYGNSYRTRGRETIAVLPVGYADGLRRSPRTWREVLVHGARAPLVGRVSMEKVTINVSHIPDVRIGDEVVLLGKQGEDEISADEIAKWIGSINYEVVTSLAPRAPRILDPS